MARTLGHRREVEGAGHAIGCLGGTVALGFGGPAAIAAIGVADSKANTATTRLRASIRWKPSVMGRRRGSAIPRTAAVTS